MHEPFKRLTYVTGQTNYSLTIELSQLRSGYSSMLSSYLSVVDNNIEDKCPNCHQISHTTEHLFNYPSAPTELTPKSLWTKPL